MGNYWKFVKEEDSILEKVVGRDHYWHFNAEVSRQADIYMVNVVMPKDGMHNFHRHPEMNEILYILKGQAEQWVEGDMKILKPGDSVYIEADVVHATFNTGDEELKFLAILSPGKGWEAGTIDEFENLPYCGYR